MHRWVKAAPLTRHPDASCTYLLIALGTCSSMAKEVTLVASARMGSPHISAG